jgi:galactose-1-phosphate uridylyltransferase
VHNVACKIALAAMSMHINRPRICVLGCYGLEDCVFCRIVENDTQASVVYSDERVLAFMDIQPVNPGHVLVIPKSHASSLAELDEETGSKLFRAAMQVA